MSVRSDMTRKFSDSVTGLVNSGMKLAGSIIDYKAKKEQLFNSNKDVLETKYRDGIQGVLKELPESVQFDQYQQRVDSYNSDFVSKARDSGVYDEKTLSWLENEFMPSQAHRNEYAVAGVTDYAVTMWIANNANSKAQTLAADPALSVDEASTMYKQYYDDKGLWSIQNGPNTYGYLTPEEFTEAIRETKTAQAFETSCKDNYGFNSKWNAEDALKQALSETGYKPSAVQMTQLRQQAQSVIEQRQKEIKAAVSQDNVNYSTDLNNHIISGQYYDTSGLEGVIASYPVSFASPLMELKVSADNYNDTVVYNMIVTGKAPLDDETLSCLTPTSDYRTTLISADVLSKAKEMFSSGTQVRDIQAWIRNGDFGYTVSAQEREALASEMMKWAKEQKTTEEEMDEIDMFYQVENPQLVGDPATTTHYTDTPVFPQATPSGNTSGFTFRPQTGSTSEETASSTSAETEQEPAATADQGVTAGTETASATRQYGRSETPEVQPAGSITPSFDTTYTAPTTSGTVTLGTTNAQNAAQATLTEQDNLPSLDHPQVYNNLFNLKYVQCAPNEVVKAKVEQAYKAGYITKDTAEELAKDFVFGQSDTWKNLIATLDERVDSLMKNSTPQQIKNTKTEIFQALVQNFGNDWSKINDTTAMNMAMDMIATDKTTKQWLRKASAYATVSADPDGYMKALSKAKFSDIRNAITDGSLMVFVDLGAQSNYLKKDVSQSGDLGNMRDFFTEALHFGTKYDGLKNDTEKLLVDYNVAYAQFSGDMTSLFRETFSDYVDTSKSRSVWVDTYQGGTFAFQDSENPDLYFFADIDSIETQDGKLAATWFYMYDTNGDGLPDSDAYKFTDIERIVSNLSEFSDKYGNYQKNAETTAQNVQTGVNELESVAFDSDQNFLVKSNALGEAAKMQSTLGFFQWVGSWFGVKKGAYDTEQDLIKATLESLRNSGGTDR